ncbi:MAG: GNAT family N-acetyltransferase [Bacteroidota bacterium]|nr:GNAT family N-acetyltransferase [Bacteroidota bacterium]
MRILEVTDKSTRKYFHKVPHLIYKNDPNWACPLEGSVEEAFDRQKSTYLKEGEICRWVLFDEKNDPIGRIAAFFHKKKSFVFDQPTGGCGFFECIDNRDAAFLLFDTAKEWLKNHGLEAMDGPVNPGENYVNWGLLAEGFMPQGYGMPYNPEYYLRLFNEYGFKVYFEQYSYHLDLTKPFPERFWKIAEWIANKPGFSFEHMKFNEMDRFVDDFVSIYDEAWRFHEHYNPLDPDDVRIFINSAKMILDEQFIWFAYHEGKPIALFAMIPDINQILRHLKGKMNLLGIAKFMYLMKKHAITRSRILIMGIIPQFQRSGIDSAIFWHLDKVMKQRPWYTEVELSWAGDFNPKIISLYKAVGGKQMKTHYTMRYLFDRNAPFRRVPIIGEKE